MSARVPSLRSAGEQLAAALPEGDAGQLQAAIDAASDMIIIMDDTPPAAGGPLIVYANAATAREFGYEPGQLIGRPPVFAFGPRSDAATVTRIVEAMIGMTAAEAEVRAYRADGTSFWTDWRGQGITDPATGRKRWIAIGRNTDERRRAEDRLAVLSTAIENANDAVFVYGVRAEDDIPRVRYVNPAGLLASGYTEAELAAGADRSGPLTELGIDAEVRAEMQAGRPLRKRLQLYRKDGSSYWAGLHYQPIADRNGSFTQWICIERDVTAEVEQEQARTDLMAMIGHDLHNPLTSILGFSELLLETLDDDEARAAVQQIRTAGKRLESLAFELLTVSRMERDVYEPRIDDVDVLELLDETIAYMPDGGRIIVDAPPRLTIRSDAGAIRHTFENLLSNALKFSAPPAPVRVELWATRGGGIGARVKDQGIGIPAADLPKIFDRAHRAKNVGGRRGTGLGLSFVKQLVESLGGRVGATSVEGEGTTFDLFLPGATAPAPPPS